MPFSNGSFDDVIAALVKSGGRLIASVHNPTPDDCIERLAGRRPACFAISNWTDEWTMRGQIARMSSWSRPLHVMTDAFSAAGFWIAVISEPQPEPGARALFPEDFELLATAPRFLFFVLQTV